MSSKQLDDFARTWILERSIILARSINGDILTALLPIVMEGQAAGESIQQIIKRIDIWFKENEGWKAKRVARTEVIAASNEGALHRYELEGIDKSEFYPAPGACGECAPLAGEYITRDSHGRIPVHPNCRCVWLPVV